jgi:sugar lactone lactonase YvrE
MIACSGVCTDPGSDAANCGRCGHDCCGGLCELGACQSRIIASGTNPGPPVVDATYVYWPDATNTSDGGILRAPKTGGSPETLTPGQDHPAAIAVDTTSLYWVTDATLAPNYGSVFKVALGGGTPTPLISMSQGAAWLLVNGSDAYWDDHTTNAIHRVALDGTNPAVLANSASVDGPLQMAIDSQSIYWASRASGLIQSCPIFGTGATTLSMGTDPVGVAVNSKAIFWANYSSGTIQKASLPNGGTATTVAISSGFGANSIAVDEDNVYWADLGSPGGKTADGGPNGAIRVASVNGTGTQGLVLAESRNPAYLALDSACVYWTDADTGNVGVVAKP